MAIISQSAPEVLENVAAAESVDTGAPGSVATFVEVPEHQASVAVPNDPQDPITLVSGDKHALSVTLPKASEASDAKLLADGCNW
ncbi:hypothetical protein DLJ96_16295 [Actinotalea fermentans ATCC 43279 = JCM 9966 = DSM 3133]|nr:hypothetical protein DLJ96_16295 [Actinotalea fermentans ATCC 43279 = JCM 9966 = DSM 3133]